jgi:hypothetical protein
MYVLLRSCLPREWLMQSRRCYDGVEKVFEVDEEVLMA